MALNLNIAQDFRTISSPISSDNVNEWKWKVHAGKWCIKRKLKHYLQRSSSLCRFNCDSEFYFDESNKIEQFSVPWNCLFIIMNAIIGFTIVHVDAQWFSSLVLFGFRFLCSFFRKRQKNRIGFRVKTPTISISFPENYCSYLHIYL